METTELLKKVRKMEIKTRGLSREMFSGQYHSAFKGRGMAFTEVREYQYGDDIRSIDWNVTARLNHPYVKVFDEERELTVMLLIDVSGSNQFGATGRHKDNVITEIAGVLAFSAISNNDKVGVIFFSDRVEKFIPPKKGSSHILRIIRELIGFQAESKGTDIGVALKYLRNAIKKRSVAFVLSDFNVRGFDEALNIVGKKHDLVCIRVFDHREKQLPAAGLIKLKDAESGRTLWVDTSSKKVREGFSRWNMELEGYFRETMRKAGVDVVNVSTDKDYVPPLMQLFRKRS